MTDGLITRNPQSQDKMTTYPEALVAQPAPHPHQQARLDGPGHPPPVVAGTWSRWPCLAKAKGRRWRRLSVAGIVGTRAAGPGARWLGAARWVAAGIFAGFGVAKFTNHAAELASFRHYPLPAPGLVVYLVGVLEIGGGLLLAAGLLTRLAALALAADMIGAVVVSGLARWEAVSLTLAPLLLATMIILIRLGAGPWSVDGQLAARLRGAGQTLPAARGRTEPTRQPAQRRGHPAP